MDDLMLFSGNTEVDAAVKFLSQGTLYQWCLNDTVFNNPLLWAVTIPKAQTLSQLQGDAINFSIWHLGLYNWYQGHPI